jgi:exodeoxyribonuclease VII large subunit
MAPSHEPPKPLTITQAANLAQKTLESLSVVMEGEVSQVTDKRGYSAVYFTLKDEHASIPCKMWQNRYQKTGVKIKVGALVQVSGRFTYYGPNGSFSFDAFSLRLAGEGMLRMQVAQLAERLRTEGLMDQARKRSLPAYPERIGLVTSPRGAAVRDVLRTLRRRYPLAEVMVCGVPVEGKGAAQEMTRALACAADAGAQVVLLGRGGGSFEDLMPFNDEGLARAVAASPVPVVTGIGHEPDNSICDMVADVRASTPTAAAEAVAPDCEAIRRAIDAHGSHMSGFFAHKLEVTRLYLDRAAHRPVFEDPDVLLGGYAQHADSLDERLRRAIPNAIARDQAHAEALSQRLRVGGSSLMQPYEHAVAMRAARLDDLSPLAVLGRGYALARDGQGHVVRSVSQAAAGDQMAVTVSDGTIDCAVTATTRQRDS